MREVCQKYLRLANIRTMDYDWRQMNECWQLLFDLLMSERARMPAIAAEFDLSPTQVHVLRLLEPGTTVPMGRLAGGLGCDASNITGVIDRLEARGLVERRAGERDRRVKVLVVTERGLELRRRLLRRISEPPEPIARLSPADQRALSAILRRALDQPTTPRTSRIS
jgi:MarR family transcriptional regulator, organic hydroperoxide resistance regulator